MTYSHIALTEVFEVFDLCNDRCVVSEVNSVEKEHNAKKTDGLTDYNIDD